MLKLLQVRPSPTVDSLGKKAVDFLYAQYNMLRDISASTEIPVNDIKKSIVSQKNQIEKLSTENKQLYKYICSTTKPAFSRTGINDQLQNHSLVQNITLNLFLFPKDFSKSFLNSFTSYLTTSNNYPDLNICVCDKMIVCQNNTKNSSLSINCNQLLKTIFNVFYYS